MSSLPDEFPDSLPVSEARDQLAELLNRALYTEQITYVTKQGQRVGAIVPVHVAQAGEDAEDAYLARLAAEAETELDAGGTAFYQARFSPTAASGGAVAPAPREGDSPAVSSTGDTERHPRT